MECPRCGESWGERCAEIYAYLLDNWMAERGVAFPEDQELMKRTACRTAAAEHQVAGDRPDVPDTPPDAESHGTSDWEALKHWEYCVGGKYEEVRRKTTSAVADNAIRGFRIAAIAANLLPGVGGIVSGAIACVSWTLQALGFFRTRTRSYKVVREQLKQMFKRDVNLPLVKVTGYDWAIAIPEIPVGMIENLIHDLRIHTFQKLGIPTRIRDDLGGRVVPASYPDDTDTRHFVQCIDHLTVFKVAELPHQIEWVFAFNPASQHAWELCRRALTDHERIYAEELEKLQKEIVNQGKTTPDGDYPPDEPKNGNDVDNGKGSNLLLPLAIFIAALIYFRDRK